MKALWQKLWHYKIWIVLLIILAAAEAAVALAIVLAIYQQFSTINMDEISHMKH